MLHKQLFCKCFIGIIFFIYFIDTNKKNKILVLVLLLQNETIIYEIKLKSIHIVQKLIYYYINTMKELIQNTSLVPILISCKHFI